MDKILRFQSREHFLAALSHFLSDCHITATFLDTSLITAGRDNALDALHCSPLLFPLSIGVMKPAHSAAACGRLGFTRTMATRGSQTGDPLSVYSVSLLLSQLTLIKPQWDHRMLEPHLGISQAQLVSIIQAKTINRQQCSAVYRTHSGRKTWTLLSSLFLKVVVKQSAAISLTACTVCECASI